MDIVELKESFEICGEKIRTKNADEMNGNGKIPALWSKFLQENYNDICEFYAVYFDYEDDVNGEYALIIGRKSSCSADYEKVKINSGKYAVFSFANESTNVGRFWIEIWKFFENSKLKRAYKADFEKYLDDKIEIYISVK